MTGEELSIKIKSFNIGNAELAALLKISPQALNSKLNASDVKVSFIIDLARVTNKSVYEWLDETEPPTYVGEKSIDDYKDKYLNLLEDYRKLSDRLTDCLDKRK